MNDNEAADRSMVYIVCPRSSDPFHIVSYCIKIVTTSWTHSILCCHLMDLSEQKVSWVTLAISTKYFNQTKNGHLDLLFLGNSGYFHHKIHYLFLLVVKTIFVEFVMLCANAAELNNNILLGRRYIHSLVLSQMTDVPDGRILNKLRKFTI